MSEVKASGWQRGPICIASECTLCEFVTITSCNTHGEAAAVDCPTVLIMAIRHTCGMDCAGPRFVLSKPLGGILGTGFDAFQVL